MPPIPSPPLPGLPNEPPPSEFEFAGLFGFMCAGTTISPLVEYGWAGLVDVVGSLGEAEEMPDRRGTAAWKLVAIVFRVSRDGVAPASTWPAPRRRPYSR